MEEADRLVRLARVQALGEDVFGDAQKANKRAARIRIVDAMRLTLDPRLFAR